MYLLSQIFAIFAFIAYILAYWQKRKYKILIYQSMDSGFDCLHYLCLATYSGAIVSVIGLVRSLTYAFRDDGVKFFQGKWLLFSLLGITILQVFFTWEGYLSLLPFASMFLLCLILWYGNEKVIRIGGIACTGIWLIYDILIGTIAGAITHGIAVLSPITALIYYDYIKKGRKEKKQKLQNTKQSNEKELETNKETEEK